MIRHALAPHVPRFAAALGVPRKLSSQAGVALTFDDGPHPEGTPAVLEILARSDARATFFVVGEQVERRPELVRRIAAEGHLVALHGFRHQLQPRRTARAVRDDLHRARAAVEEITGTAAALHRPPYGVYSPAGLDAVREAGLQPLLWSRWGRDWRRFTTPERIAGRVLARLVAGDVILLHDADFYSGRGSHRNTVEALKMIMNDLTRRKVGTVLPV